MEARNQQSAAVEEAVAQERKKARENEDVDSYMFFSQVDGELVETPMFVVCYEELYAAEDDEGADPDEVVAIRIWKLVFDKDHSDSHLVNRLITENRRRTRHAGMAHCSVSQRSDKMVREHNRAIRLVGSTSTENVALEYYAGNQYLRVTSVHDLINLIKAYGGKTDTFPGYMPIDLGKLPDGALNHPMKGIEQYGGDSHLGPENVFCAKNKSALGAALVDFDSTPLNVNLQQLDPQSYFTADGTFQIPEVCRQKKAFWVQTNPSVLHPYDMSLPRPIAGIEAPGKELLSLFAREKCGFKGTGDPTTQPHLNLVNRFKNMCTGVDQTTAKMLREATDTIFSFDATEVSEADRKVASMAKAGSAQHGLVGSFEKGAAVIEPRQVLKQLGDETSTVVRKLIAPWEEKARAEIALEAGDLKKDWQAKLKAAKTDKHLRDEAHAKYKAGMQALADRSDTVQKQHVTYKRELFEWGGEKFFRAFTSRYDRDSIPTGYRAVWDGLVTELKDTENGSACIAVCEDLQLTDSHKSVYSHAMNFWGRWFEHDCFRTFAVSNPQLHKSPACPPPRLPCSQAMGAIGACWRRSSSRCARLRPR